MSDCGFNAPGCFGSMEPAGEFENVEIRLEDLDVAGLYPSTTRWVRPKVDVTILNPGLAFREIAKKLPSLYRMEVDECFGGDDCFDVRIEELRASCPYCVAGTDQTLTSENWIQVFDWSPSAVFTLSSAFKAERGHSDVNAEMEEFNKAFFGILGREDTCIEKNFSSENVYGISSNDLNALNPYQLSFNFPGVSHGVRSVSGPSELTGMYRCPHCGSSFAVSLCRADEYVSSGQERKIREAILWLLDPLEDLKRVNVSILKTNSDIEVACEIDGMQYSVVFELATGVTRFDGRRPQGIGMLSHPIFESSIFGNVVLVRRIAEMLGLPHTELSWGSSTENALLLIAANRFLGYPADFYRGLAEDEDLLLKTCDKASVFPRRYEKLRDLFELTGLPNKKSIKRRLFSDPLLFCRVIAGSDIPFQNIDIICQFLDLPRNHPLHKHVLSSQLGDCFVPNGEALSMALRVIGEEKGEIETFRYFAALSERKFGQLLETIDDGYWMYAGHVRKLIAETPLKKLGKLLHFLSFERNHSFMDIDRPYVYSESHRRLEGIFRGFEFKLPDAPKDMVEASFELSNCLDGYAHRQLAFGEFIVLIAKGNKLVGAVSLDVDNRVIQARSACNYDLDSVEGLQDAFNDWCKCHGVRTGECDELAA